MRTDRRRDAARPLCPILVLALLGTLAAMAGCEVVGFAAYAVQSGTPKKVEAQYSGLDGKSFAVVVNVERSIQGEFTALPSRLTTAISEDLKKNTQATAYIPPNLLLARLYENPRWTSMTAGEIARMLQVERLVYVEVLEFHLNEPGNRHVWAGVAAGRLVVIETDGVLPDDPVFEKGVQVTFPDQDGFTEAELPASGVATELSRRFAQRIAWMFYKHEEPRDIAY